MKTVLITGCNGGLGKELLKKFTSNGYNVLACSFPQDDGFIKECDDIAQNQGVDIKHFSFNSTKQDELEAGCKAIEVFENDIDVLINCAGANIIKPLMYTEFDDLQKTFLINYFATVLITKAVAGKMMMQGNGCIINISSIGSLGQQTGGACYDASKAAMNQFTKSIAQELAPFNIRVNAIAPAPMRTAMFENMPEKTRKNLVKNVAFKRPVEPAEVANVASFLASDNASFITGQIIRVDGGALI